tara:strand:+ start:2672 stop:3364 length:693 start_codon:yes stop_codon:yes gene_type:complete
MVFYLNRIGSSKRTGDKEKLGGSILKLGDFGIKQYELDRPTATLLRDSLLQSEDQILGLGESQYDYPEDQITGKMPYYNLLSESEDWYTYCLPFVKKIVADYLSLQNGDIIMCNSWGNILRLNNKIYPHRHFGIPPTYDTNPQSVSGNIFLGAEIPTATTYILGGQKIDVPNEFGLFTLFPPNLSHAVRAYEGEGVRVSAAFDCICTSRDPDGKVTGNLWYKWTHNENLP